MTTRYELHVWSTNADLAVADRIIPLPPEVAADDEEAEGIWRRNYNTGVRLELVKIERGLRSVLKAVF